MRVLVVDDNRLNSALVRASLEGSHVVEVAVNGTDGLARALGERFDLILLDIGLPGLRGDVVCTRLREAGHRGPIVALTASALPDELSNIERVGFDLVLTKPISPDDLRIAIEGFSSVSPA